MEQEQDPSGPFGLDIPAGATDTGASSRPLRYKFMVFMVANPLTPEEVAHLSDCFRDYSSKRDFNTKVNVLWKKEGALTRDQCLSMDKTIVLDKWMARTGGTIAPPIADLCGGDGVAGSITGRTNPSLQSMSAMSTQHTQRVFIMFSSEKSQVQVGNPMIQRPDASSGCQNILSQLTHGE